MTDIVDRLLRHWDGKRLAAVSTDVADAADTITELREELREAREVTQLCADALSMMLDRAPDPGGAAINAMNKADAFLAKTQPKGTDE